MKKLLVLIILFLLAIASIWGVSNLIPKFQKVEQQKRFEYYKDDQKGIYVIAFKEPLEYLTLSKPQLTLDKVSIQNNFAISINGGFFNADYTHSGLYIKNGELIQPSAKTDKQLTHAVILEDGKIMGFKSIQEDFKIYLNDSTKTIFQTGPLLIDSDKVRTDLIDQSVNGKGKYLRTLLGYTLDGKYFFIATSKTYTLSDIADEIKKIPLLKSSVLNVINLDGGASTAMYSSENEDYDLFNYKILPNILGVR